MIKAIGFVTGILAACRAWSAARPWLEASAVSIPELDLPPASMDDAPSVHILTAVVQLNEIKQSYDRSALLNAHAAKWTARAAVAGVATIVGLL